MYVFEDNKHSPIEAKWLAEEIEIESSEEKFTPYDEIHWEDEYYAYLSNSENDEGRTEYFDKYQEAKNQLEEMRKGKEARSMTPPPTFTAKVTNPPTSLYPEAVAMQPNGQTDISMVEVTIKTTPQKPPSSLYPNVVMIGRAGTRKGHSNRSKSRRGKSQRHKTQNKNSTTVRRTYRPV
ncbi:hypothetical protein JTB14_012089 [Gonioctena quinquepunctata]|nr:hypothetical protein JTB14_012089 [Gonioctena quinquepunctata]